MVYTQRVEKRTSSIPLEFWSRIAHLDKLKGQCTAGIKLDPQTLGRLKQSVLITSTGASTRIERARLSDDDVEKLMKDLDIQKFTDRDKQEAKGYFELLENVFNSFKSIKFSENTIKHFHKELLKYTHKDELQKGEYKKKENKVHMSDKTGQSVGVLFDTTPAYLVPKEMQKLVEWVQKGLHERKIHPFEDGNGRLSRILTNLLLQTGYLYIPYVSHEKLIEDNKPDYHMALRKSQSLPPNC